MGTVMSGGGGRPVIWDPAGEIGILMVLTMCASEGSSQQVKMNERGRAGASTGVQYHGLIYLPSARAEL